MGVHVNDLSPRTQDYLKALWNITERSGAPVPLGELAGATGQKTSTASEAVKRLAADGLVKHQPYAGVELTDAGRTLATAMVRRHRLVETFLVETLDYTWDEVHDDAEMLEHALSDRFIDRLDAHLGNPTRDPHGDPIPRADGLSDPLSGLTLADVLGDGEATETTVVVEQVNDHDPTLLRYLAEHGIAPGTRIRVRPPQAGLARVLVAADTDGAAPQEAVLAEAVLTEIRVSLP